MRLFGAYLRQRRGDLLLLLSFCAVFCVSFLLYRLPVAAVLYPALLCVWIGGVYLAVDFARLRRRHAALCAAKGTAARLAELPDAAGIAEADYRELVRQLREETERLETEAAARCRDMTEYYTVWVHQIKTPITSMRLRLQDENTELAEALLSDLFRIEQYVQMVLAYLRLDSESGDYVFRTHDVDGIVRQAVAKFAPEFISRGIRLEYEPAEGTVVTDDKWLSFVVEQLLSNALKYSTRAGSIRIFLREKTLCIADTGIGIAPEDLPRVFEKGYTGCNGRLDKRASGLGLYLCRRVCDRLGIGIRLASEPGRGTTAFLDLAQYTLRRE